MAEMEQNLLRAEKKMEKTEKKQGGILGALTSKWAIIGATVAGVGYAMIKASPSLSYAMEEVQYRFEDMLAIIGEQFAPLIEEILIPALDMLMPLIQEFAPMIGKMVGMVVEAIKPLTPIFERVIEIIGGVLGDLFSRLDDPAMQETLTRFIDAFGRIATAVLDVAEEVIPILFDVLETLEPVFTGMLLGAIEGFASAIETIATAISSVIDWIKGNEKLMGWLGKLEELITGDVVKAIETFWGYIEDLIDWIGKENGLVWWLGFLAGLLEGGLTKAIDWIWEKFKWLGDKIKDTIDFIYDLITAIGLVPSGPGWDSDASIWERVKAGIFPQPIGGQTGIASVPKDGMYYLHGGEQVSPPHSSSFGGGGGMSMGDVIIQIDSVTLSQDMDVYDFADKLSKRFKDDVQRNWY